MRVLYVTYFQFLGPGQYDPKGKEHRGNMMTGRDTRIKDKYLDTPGPGTYEVSKTWN